MLAEIAQSTYDYQEYPVVMQNVWKRVNESGKNWRIVYKVIAKPTLTLTLALALSLALTLTGASCTRRSRNSG
jgi:hypothetical protein